MLGPPSSRLSSPLIASARCRARTGSRGGAAHWRPRQRFWGSRSASSGRATAAGGRCARRRRGRAASHPAIGAVDRQPIEQFGMDGHRPADRDRPPRRTAPPHRTAPSTRLDAKTRAVRGLSAEVSQAARSRRVRRRWPHRGSGRGSPAPPAGPPRRSHPANVARQHDGHRRARPPSPWSWRCRRGTRDLTLELLEAGEGHDRRRSPRGARCARAGVSPARGRPAVRQNVGTAGAG